MYKLIKSAGATPLQVINTETKDDFIIGRITGQLMKIIEENSDYNFHIGSPDKNTLSLSAEINVPVSKECAQALVSSIIKIKVPPKRERKPIIKTTTKEEEVSALDVMLGRATY